MSSSPARGHAVAQQLPLRAHRLGQRRTRRTHWCAIASTTAVTEVVSGSSIANDEAILQGAVNRAVSRRESPVRVRLEAFQRAASSVNGA